jgi:hypothetical protein
MFLSELTPLFKALTQQPVAFCGGFVSGLLRLNLGAEPARTWLAKMERCGSGSSGPVASPPTNGDGPQSISID